MNKFNNIIKNITPKYLDKEQTTLCYKWCVGNELKESSIYCDTNPIVLISFDSLQYTSNSYCCGMKF